MSKRIEGTFAVCDCGEEIIGSQAELIIALHKIAHAIDRLTNDRGV